MEAPTTPKQHPRVTSIQNDLDVGRTPSYPTANYSSSTNIGDAKTNLKTILATRVSFNDPNIVDVLFKPDEVSADIVQALQDYISKHGVITQFLADVGCGAIGLESDMYEPLCELLNAIINYNKKNDPKSDEKHVHNEEEDGVKDDNGGHPTSKPANATDFARRISRIWLDVHSRIPKTDPHLFIPGMPTDDHVQSNIKKGQKRAREDDEDYVDTPRVRKLNTERREKGKTDSFEKRRPDLVLVDHETKEFRQESCLWRHIAVLLEVKRDPENGPNPADGTTLTSLVAQLADMARLHLAARPFMRFSVHLTVCGAIFNLAIFDRAGGVISKDYNIIKDLETFIRIIRRLGRDLDAYDLGLDRTVVPLHTLGSWRQYPKFRVTVGGSVYITQGVPLWQSTGLVGRGTFVWRVVLEADARKFGKGKGKVRAFILKNAWRACARLAESTVYKMLNSATEESTSHLTNLDGVAQFVDGGDVYDPQQPNEVVKVSSHRKGFGKPINENDEPVLHRLVLASQGRKLNEFTTFSQLMRAAKKMSSGLRALHERGIIHGDISLGNLFLGITDDIAGFVGDLDLAKVDLEIIKRLFPNSYDEVAKSKRGALRTGTAIFMSMSLLTALANYYDPMKNATKNPSIVANSGLDFVPGPGDDLESMIWVITYAIMLHHQESLEESDRTNYQRSVVNNFYGSLSYSGLAEKRDVLVFRGYNPRSRGLEKWIPDPIQCQWFRRAMTLVAGQTMSTPDDSITFDTFDALCDEFITDE